MAYEAGSAATILATMNASSYRVKFKRGESLELVAIDKPKIIYRSGRMHFFSYDGFVMYSLKCRDVVFGQKVLRAIEFSNIPWRE
ncbi:MAG: hypothetical protein ACTSUV_02370 [Candidatus Ranarchaeia archaeon]